MGLKLKWRVVLLGVKGLKIYFCTSLVSGQARWQTCWSMVPDPKDRKLIT